MALVYNLIVFIILLFPLYCSAQNAGNITVGATLTATENSTPWRSPSGDFAFGFQRLRDNNSNNLFILSIWFDRIPDRTIVWYLRGIDPVPRGSTVQLNARDGLVLRDPQGRLVYNTNGLADEVAYGFLNNTGNLVLYRSDTTSLWNSFRNPSDTILPTQTMQINGDLVSRVSETNFSEGRFRARMNSNGNFVLNTRSLPTNTIIDDEYYSSGTSDANSSNSGFQVLFNERALISVMRRNGQESVLTPSSIPPVSGYYHRAILSFDGVLLQYYHLRNYGSSPGWSIAGSWPENICGIDGTLGSGACGYNSVCMIENRRPICHCPIGFSLADPNNAYGDCNPNFVQSCVGNETGSQEFDMLDIADTDWPYGDYEEINQSTQDNCRSACFNDCLCGVSIFRSNTCWKKKLPLSNGRVDITAFLKFRRGDIPILTTPDHRDNINNTRNNQKNLIVIGTVLLSTSAFINLLFISAACLGFFLIYNKKNQSLRLAHDASEANIRCFTYKELVHATDGFKEELGRGAFGIVYKGFMPNGSGSVIAVKKLDRVAGDSEKEFKTEVNVIGQTHHKNLVRLLGFCNEGPNRLLVYEYMCNGTLSSFVFGTPKPSWKQRTEIALGVAHGLTYLHEECSTQIIHCDIKPQNILLDESHNARISDFGLAKLLMMNQSRTMTDIRGTKGYIAPEWFRNTPVSTKVDVYSFGVVLLEIICCRKSLEDSETGFGDNGVLTDWVWDCYQEGRWDSLVGGDLEALSDGEKLEKFVMVGIWCIQEDACLRPSMRRVCQMLEGIVDVDVPPCPCPFTSSIWSKI